MVATDGYTLTAIALVSVLLVCWFIYKRRYVVSICITMALIFILFYFSYGPTTEICDINTLNNSNFGSFIYFNCHENKWDGWQKPVFFWGGKYISRSSAGFIFDDNTIIYTTELGYNSTNCATYTFDKYILFCLHLYLIQNNSLKSMIQITPNEYLYGDFVGYHDNKIYMAGKKLRQIDIETGEVVVLKNFSELPGMTYQSVIEMAQLEVRDSDLILKFETPIFNHSTNNPAIYIPYEYNINKDEIIRLDNLNPTTHYYDVSEYRRTYGSNPVFNRYFSKQNHIVYWPKNFWFDIHKAFFG